MQETVEEHAAKHAGQYDVVTCMEMLEHVPIAVSGHSLCATGETRRRCLFSTLHRIGKSWLMAVVGADIYVHGAKGTHDVKKFIKPAELLGWVIRQALKSDI